MGCPEETDLLHAEMHTRVVSLSRVDANLFSTQGWFFSGWESSLAQRTTPLNQAFSTSIIIVTKGDFAFRLAH